MRIVGLANEKGGVGKTAACINLACHVASLNAPSIIIDMDPQGSTMDWGRTRGSGSNPETVTANPHDLEQVIKDCRRAGVAWCFLDLPGRSAPVTTAGIKAANIVLIPARPFDIDLAGARDVVEACKKLRRKYAFLMSIAPPNSSRSRDVTKALGELGHRVAPVVIHNRLSVADAVSLGRGVCEHEPRGAAAAEFAALYDWVENEI